MANEYFQNEIRWQEKSLVKIKKPETLMPDELKKFPVANAAITYLQENSEPLTFKRFYAFLGNYFNYQQSYHLTKENVICALDVSIRIPILKPTLDSFELFDSNLTIGGPEQSNVEEITNNLYAAMYKVDSNIQINKLK
jgi:hypothetical protein